MYLVKLKKGTNPSYGQVYINQHYCISSMKCANGFKEGLKHKFISNNKSDIKLLIDLIRRFRFSTIITNITENSFEFESETEQQQIFFFRICRYVRRNNIRKILEDTIMINKLGVKIQNAFLLAHYYNYQNNSLILNITYYNTSMDGFYDPSNETNIRLNKPFKLLKDFKEALIPLKNKNNITYNYLFMYTNTANHKNDKELIFKFLKEKDFKAAEKYLLHVWK